MYSVCLDDGHFQVNQVPFFIHEGRVKDLRLIYFRRNHIDYDATLTVEQGRTVEFHLGWQGTDIETGKNVQHTMILP